MDPKVYFAVERTYLAWTRAAVLLAGAAVAMEAFADSSKQPWTLVYGVMILPFSIGFIVYAMYQCELLHKSK